MYVALTRAERYLFVTHSGTKRSRFFDTVEESVEAAGGATAASGAVPKNLRYLPSSHNKELPLVTSFFDLRYYLACPHD